MSKLKELLRSVDWPRALHMASTFARELQGDAVQLEEDDRRARSAARKLRGMGEQAARQSAGCTGSTGVKCACIVCDELGAPQ